MEDIGTPPDVLHAIRYGIDKFLEQEHFGQNTDIEWPPTNFTYDLQAPTHRQIEKAFNSQTEIGWDEFIRGRIGNEWGNIMAQHYHRTEASNRHNRKAWEQQLLKCIWNLFEVTWNARNALEHGIDQQANDKIQDAKINDDIQRTYLYDRNSIDPHDAKQFHTPLHILLQKTLDYKRAWLRSMYIAKSQWATEQGAENPLDRGPTQNNSRSNDPDVRNNAHT
jgi:hypothetical protein